MQLQHGQVRRVLVSCSIAANAISAGGIYSFPLISPALVAHMKLTQPQLSAIMLAAMIGQYATAVPVGKVLDRYGPWSCSLLASLVFSTGYGLFALTYARSPVEATKPSTFAFLQLVFYFGLLGLGTILSYFAMLFAATRTFPQYIGLVSGTSLAIFGMSPLVISMVATKFFTDNGPGVNVTSFFVFLSVVTGLVNFFGALVLPGPTAEEPLCNSSAGRNILDLETHSHNEEGGESDPLLGPSADSADDVMLIPAPEPEHLTAWALLQDYHFWVLAVIVSLVVGAAEMIKSNIGLIVLSLPSTSTSQSISIQVQLIAVSDTLTRLLVGPLADFLSPVATYHASGVWAFPRKPYITRVWFLASASLVFAASFIWSILAIRTQENLWPLSISTGIANGTIFTMLPSILSSIWGSPNQGRNFGFVSYTCFIGTTLFSYLYTFIADSHTRQGEGVCHGVQCWQMTFCLSTSATLLSTSCCILLWRKWRSRL